MPIPCLPQWLYNETVKSEGVITLSSELCVSKGMLDHEDKGSSIFRKVGNYLPAEMA